MQYAELIAPRVVKYPEIKPAFLLVIPANGTERFQPSNLSLYVVSFQIDMHAFF